MAVQNKVNIKQMRKIAEQMNDRGVEFTKRLQRVFSDVEELQKYWVGQAYVDFATTVNRFDDNFQRISKYFVATLPEEINKKANAYAKAQNEGIINDIRVQAGVLGQFSNVPIKDQGDSVAFDDAKAQAIQDKIEERFSNAIKDLNIMTELYDEIPWTGTARTASIRTFRKYVNETIDIITKIQRALNANMKATIKANRAVEEGNTKTSDKADMSGLDGVASSFEASTRRTDSQNYDWTSK